MPLYFAVTLVIGWLSKRGSGTANAFLNASRSLPLPVVSIAYLAANCGALEIVGLSAMAAEYGVEAFHFYWIGAIPAMVLLGVWMMPVYRRSGVRSIPEYLEVRYGRDVRLLNACVIAITVLLLAGISLYAMAQVLEVIIGLHFFASIVLSSGVVLTYVLVGGIRATIYNEVFQLLVMLAGLIPLSLKSIAFLPAAGDVGQLDRYHLWRNTDLASPTSRLDGLGVTLGLGFVLGVGYWCTDFVQMQRAFTAKTESEARQVPLWAGFGKLIFSFIVVLPGLAAYRLLPQLGHTQRFDQALPALMKTLYGPTMLSLGLTALAASLMSGLAANVSAVAAIWTEDIYRARIRRNENDAHYLFVGRVTVAVAVIISLLSSYLNFYFSNLMEHVQLIFSVFGSPFWAIFLLGMTTRRTTERGALIGFAGGAALSFLHSIAVNTGMLHYGSIMSANFYAAIYAFTTATLLGFFASGTNGSRHVVPRMVFQWPAGIQGKDTGLLWVLSGMLLLTCIALNIYWW